MPSLELGIMNEARTLPIILHKHFSFGDCPVLSLTYTTHCITGRNSRPLGQRDYDLEDRLARERKCRTLFVRNVAVGLAPWSLPIGFPGPLISGAV